MQPFSVVASSIANQKPTTDCGSVQRNVWSVWQLTSPPILGCLKMYIDCKSLGELIPICSASAPSFSVWLNALNWGSRSCIAWPSLLRHRCASSRNVPAASNASFSKKQRILSPLDKKYSSAACFALESAVKIVACSGEGTYSFASCMARSRNAKQASSLANLGSTTNPSV